MSRSERFEVGDRVRCVDAGSTYLTNGSVYQVMSVDPAGGNLSVHPWPLTLYSAERFEPVDEGPSTPTDGGADPLAEFKKQVWQAAQAAKAEHGWCGEVDAILAELGVQDPNPRVKYRVMIPVEIRARRAEGKDAIDLVRNAAVGAVFGAISEFTESDVSVERVKGRLAWTVEEVTG